MFRRTHTFDARTFWIIRIHTEKYHVNKIEMWKIENLNIFEVEVKIDKRQLFYMDKYLGFKNLDERLNKILF